MYFNNDGLSPNFGIKLPINTCSSKNDGTIKENA